MGFPDGSEVKASAWNEGDPGSIPELGRSPGEGNGNPLQYSGLENPMEGGAWWAAVHRVAKSWTRLSNFTHSYIHVCVCVCVCVCLSVNNRKTIKIYTKILRNSQFGVMRLLVIFIFSLVLIYLFPNIYNKYILCV